MSALATAWLVIFGVSAACFFAIAAVVTVLGVRDMKELLRPHK